MKIVGLILARNEEWVLGLSLRAALRWCDHVVVLDHASTDKTGEIVRRAADDGEGRITYGRWADGDKWDEMALRQMTLDMGREAGGTHFAIIDADEFLTCNLLGQIRGWFEALRPRECIELPMVPAWKSLRQYRDDSSVWSGAFITLGFRDAPTLCWKPAGDSYQHHNRPPYGINGGTRPIKDKKFGGVVHAQFANPRRLLAKHVLYRMVDHLRWPGRESVGALNVKYDQALDERGIKYSDVPTDWLDKYALYIENYYDPEGEPWQESEVRRLLKTHGRGKFTGLDLKGF